MSSRRVRVRHLVTLCLGAGLLPMLQATPSLASPVYSFTNATATGSSGPTQSNVNSAYSGTSLAAAVTVNTQGVQEWTVPFSGNYSFEVVGAHGAAATTATNVRGGRSVKITATRSLTAGDIVYIVVGQAGTADASNGGGGGASFVSIGSRTATTNLLVAGGGGGTRTGTAVDGGDASTTTAGTTSSSASSGTAANLDNTTNQGGTGGLATVGYGGRISSSWGDAGAGWLGDGLDDGYGARVAAGALRGTAVGGSGAQSGGFGGGGAGAGSSGGGGGGGYTGGNGGWVAGGGGSFDAGFTSVTKAIDSARSFNRGGTPVHGYVTITSLGPSVSSFSPTTTLTNSTTLTYNLVFTQSVTGLISGDFTVSGTGSSTCSVGSPSGSTTTYQVQVTGCSAGTVVLALRPNSVANSTSQTGPPDTATASTVTIDRTAPTISSVETPSATTYGPGTNINFTVRFSESVTVTGTPRLPLTIGSTQRYATWVSNSDSRTAVFRYTVATDSLDIDTDGVSLTSPAETSGAVITDLAGNNMTNLSFTSPNLSSVKVAQRAAAPTINSISPSSATLSVAFTAGSDNGGTITSYQYSTDNGSTWRNRASGGTTSPISITTRSDNGVNLSNNVAYQVRIRALTTLNDTATAGESSTAVTATPTDRPSNTVPPSISGSVSVGSRLTASTGTWTNSPTSYSYRWSRSQTLSGTYTAISGATSDSYTITSGDNSYFIRVAVTATNSQGSNTETSSATSQVKVPITISGGSNITTTAGTAASSSTFTASGGLSPVVLSVTPVHPQISISGGVVTAGASLPAGSYTETVTATDSLGDTATTTLTITVQSIISAPAFTVSKGTLPGSFKLNFSPVTGASSYTVKVYKSNDSFTSPFVTINNYVSGSDIQDGDPKTCGNSSTPICYGIAVGHTFKFTITPVASAGYSSAGEGAQSSKFAMYRPFGASVTAPREGVVGLDVSDAYWNQNVGKSGVIAYIYRNTDNFVSVYETASITGTSWNRIALPSGDSYTVSLKHLGATVGDTVWLDSDESSRTSPAIMVWNKPNAPSNITATRNGSESIRISWTRASGPYQTYYYHVSTDGTNWGTSRGNTTSDSATIAGLTNGTAYYVRVYNYGSDSYARASDYVIMSGTITPAGTPGPVATGSSSPGDASIVLGWTAPTSNGGSAITGYLIEYSATSATYSESITALSSDTRLTLSGLINGTSYYVRIKAVNEIGAGTAVEFGGGSAILVKGTAGSIVGAVTSVARTTATISATINARGNTTTPTLRWGLVDGTQTDVTLSSVTSDNVVVTSNLTGLTPGRRYQVTSTTNPGISQDVGGRPIYFTTTPNSISSASSTTTTSSITVSWSYEAGGNGYGYNYDAIATLNGVQVGAGCQDVTAASGGLHSCQFTGLTANTAYVISITKSITGGDYGNGASDPYTLTVSTDPNVATITLSINGGNTSLQRGSAINIVATTNVAGVVTFRLNGRVITNCKSKATSSLMATCLWRPSVHGPASISAFFNPTSNLYPNVTTNPTAILVARRTSRS